MEISTKKDTVIWEWKDDEDKWISFDNETSEILDVSYYYKKRLFVELKYGLYNSSCIIYFRTMRQINTETKSERDIRCLISSSTSSCASWCWLKKETWIPFSDENCILLENAFKDYKSTVDFTVVKNNYVADFNRMVQVNVKTGYERKICRFCTKKYTNSRPPPLGTIKLRKRPEKDNPCEGTILITIHEAKDFYIPNFFPRCYVEVKSTMNPLEFRTKQSKNEWNEHFELKIKTRSTEGKLSFILIYNHLIGSNEYLGRLDIRLSDIVNHDPIVGVQKLTYESRRKPEDTPPGQLTVTIVYRANEVSRAQDITFTKIINDLQLLQLNEEEVLQEESEESTNKLLILRKRHKEAIRVNEFENVYEIEEPPIYSAEPNQIFKGRFKETGDIVAIKKITKKGIVKTDQEISQLLNEISITLMINHENCVSSFASKDTNDYMYIVLEFVDGGDLLNIISSTPDGKLEMVKAKQCMFDILSGLQYLHNNNIAHCDLKPENILYCSKSHLFKISDFGCSFNFQSDDHYLSGLRGTQGYMAPEIILENKFTKLVDLWSCGVIAYTITTGYIPWGDPIESYVIQGNVDWDPLIELGDNQLVNFVKKLLVLDSSKRMSPYEAMCHPWLQDNDNT